MIVLFTDVSNVTVLLTGVSIVTVLYTDVSIVTVLFTDVSNSADMSENTLKIGFVGAGGIHFGKNKPWAHATRLEKIGGIDVVAIVDPKTDLAQKVLEEKLANDEVRSLYKNCRVFANFRQLLELKPDAVFIGSPPAYRGCLLNNHDMELQFVKAGIHTFVEKPLSVIPPEEFEMYATEMKNAIKETNVVVSVGYMFR